MEEGRNLQLPRGLKNLRIKIKKHISIQRSEKLAAY